MADTEVSSPAELRIYRQSEQLNILRTQVMFGSLGTVSFACFCWYFFWGRNVDHSQLTTWSVIAVVCAFANAINAFLSKQTGEELEPVLKQRLLRFTVLGGLTGVIWSFPGILLYDIDLTNSDNVFLAIFVIVGLMAMGGGALGSITAYLPTYYVSVLPFLLPLVVVMLVSSSEVFPVYAIGLLLVMYVGSLCGFAFFINKAIIESIDLRRSNLDLAEQYRTEKNRAEQANTAKSRFLASASHDLRQPLHALGFLIEALKSAHEPVRMKQIVHSIEGSSDALRELLNVILDLSKLEAGAVHAKVVPLPLQQVFERLSDNFRLAAQDKGLSLKFVATNQWVESDVVLLERILMNLVSNAIRYTDSGGVRVVCRKHNGRACIQVWDTGCGIDSQNVGNIYNEYYQVENAERDRAQGLGLGLSIVAGLCDVLEHEIAVKSEQGKGTVFSLSLPLSKPVPVENGVVGRYTEKTDVDDRHDQVLIVDDDPAVLASISQLVMQWGYQVEVAATFEEAEQVVQQGFAPGLILSDYRLKGELTGADLLHRLIAGWLPAAKGIIVTGDTDPTRITEAKNSGFLLLHKPLRPAKLRIAMRNLIDQSPCEQEVMETS